MYAEDEPGTCDNSDKQLTLMEQLNSFQHLLKRVNPLTTNIALAPKKSGRDRPFPQVPAQPHLQWNILVTWRRITVTAGTGA